MTLPGSAPVAAMSEKMRINARAAGARIVELVWQDIKPREILSAASIENAVKVVLALSGSINCVKHLQAIATEAGLDVDVYGLFAKHSDHIPLLAAIRPNGPGLIEELEAAGGARAVMKQLEPVLALETRTVAGISLGEVLADVHVADTNTIRGLEDPLSRRPSLVVVRGNLLPGGGIVRQGGTGERMSRFRGPAKIFHSRDEALEAIKQGAVHAGDVVVLRGLGVIGGPGMAMTSAVVFALDGAGLINEVACITEGQLSGLVNEGLVVGEASPEAAAGGPLALVQEGDSIAIDVERKTVDLEVSESVLAERRKRLGTFGATGERGWLAVYQKTVAPVHEGAVLK
jgi:dihydroxy-acid dehydratase